MQELYSVRDLSEADVPAVIAILREVHKESTYSHMEFSESKCATLLRLGRGDLWGQVIVCGERVIGVMVAQIEEAPFSYDRIARLLALAVKRSHRGKSFIAVAQIVQNYHTWARKGLARRIFLHTDTGIRAREIAELYERLGFQQVGTIHEA